MRNSSTIAALLICTSFIFLSPYISGQSKEISGDSSLAKELPFESEEDDSTATDGGDPNSGNGSTAPASQTEPSVVSVSPSFSFREMITVSSNTAIDRIGLYSIGGKQVFMVERPEDNELSFSPRGLSAGMYLLRVKTTTREHVKKIMVTK